MLGSDRKMLKSRSGEPVRFVDVVDEAIERATAAVLEKNPDLPAEERTEIGRKVGVGALKYADLSTDRIKDYVFDWDRMLAFEGNTGRTCNTPMPGFVRSCAGWRRRRQSDRDAEAARRPRSAIWSFDSCSSTPQSKTRSTSSARIGCARTCSNWPRPSPSFYEACPVLKADDATRQLRLQLCEQTARILAKGLDLLGIEAPERM